MPVFMLDERLLFPPPAFAEDGLLAVGGDLSVERLLLAYRSGIFPWYSEDEPLLWWSPDPRMVITPESLHVSRRLSRVLRSGRFTVTLDTCFAEVMGRCASVPRPRQRGTWIVRDMIDAYVRLHAEGYAHSIECWQEGALCGGLYGVSLGGCFFGESMFSLQPDASKVALVRLVEQCAAWGMPLIDCQTPNPHLRRMGAFEMARARFMRELKLALEKKTRRGRWFFDNARSAAQD
ncbi:MAG: leucyl/phenylalanyl-tRNA--protein transferase [Candidatus Hydrogenedentes bacterium]|nr:leucyl/phenylalanyl-tRNA--protein transferase [Candidatus Hydrogenedentota bacterium]